jgi:2,5-diamino-6-(ribosylamino)-4(3H)-pyrimidinone 5'-phosphate reductase
VKQVVESLPFSGSLMVEGGASVICSFLESGLVDHLIVTVAPVLIGDDGISVTAGSANTSTRRMQHAHTEQFGRDSVVACRFT